MAQAWKERPHVISTIQSFSFGLRPLMLAQVETQTDLSEVNFYGEYGTYLDSLDWPDMTQALDTRDFGYIAGQALDFAQKARNYLAAHSAPLNEFTILEAAQTYIQGVEK